MPPNLLFLFTDEQRADTMAAYGNSCIQTPNLDRLAVQSVLFERAYVTQPVCTPSRATLLTGLYPHTCGCTENNVPLPAATACLPELLRPGEYATAYYGKWHLGDELFAQHGFAEWRSIEDIYNGFFSPGRDREERSDYCHWLLEQGLTPANGRTFGRGQAARLPERLSKPAYLAQEACRFIRENRRRPFVLFVNFLEPHMPFFGPRDGQYDPDEVLLPENFDAPPTEDQPLAARLSCRVVRENGHSGLPLRTEADWRRMIANYWGLCSLVDTHVGEILSALEDCGLDGETIVVYTSDHGDMMGSHRLLAKCLMFEEAVRVPLMVRLPRGRGRRVAAPVSQVDLVPTLLDLMGQPFAADGPPAPGLDGYSLRPLLEGTGAAPEEDVFIEWSGRNASALSEGLRGGELAPYLCDMATYEEAADAARDPVRSVLTPDGWKLNWSRRGDHELYDLNADPGERRNLAADPAARPRMRDLADRIRRWQERTADSCELPAL